MQERGQTPYPDQPPQRPGDQPGPAPSTQGGKKPRSRRDTLLGCGCLSLLAVGAIIVVAAIASSGKPGSNAGPSSSTPPAATTTAAAASAAAAAGGASTQAGFGTTVQSWDATRNPDAAFDPGSVYSADPTLPQINGHTGARYTAVQRQLGYVISYQINFHPHTSISAALADVLRREFPADATYLWKRTMPGQCYQAEVKSPALATALNGTGIGDGTGTAFLEAKTLPPGGVEGFDPSDVTYADLSFMTVTSADQAPGC